jgi:carbamoyl-phosphate synthase small subunit
MESEGIWARAAIMREAVNREDAPEAERGWLDWLADCGIPAITGVDTRALVRHIRDAGAMRGGVFSGDIGPEEARALIAAEPAMAGQDLAALVTPKQAHTVGAASGATKIHAIDTGIKSSIVRHLVARGAQVTLHPCTVTSEELLATDADAFFLANGPGDPAALGYVVDTVAELVGKRPVWGICLGHQLLCQADGGGRVEADEPVRWKTDFGDAALTHVNLYDRTVEGLELLEVNGATVQYHPEAGPGPNDALYQFDRFLDAVRSA